MNKIKDALWQFLGNDAVLEWEYDCATISGTSKTLFVIVRSPKSKTPNDKWVVEVYPRATADSGYPEHVSTTEDTDVEVCNWFADNDDFIREMVLEILTVKFKALQAATVIRRYLNEN